jgi:hypothetical protein
LPLLIALLAGCGGDDGGPSAPAGPDPATVTPADAPLFASGVVRPEGDRKEALESALSKLLATDDPGGLVVEQADEWLASEDAGLAYQEDIEPWLGEQAGMFVKTFEDDADVAIVIAATDPEAANAAVAKAAAADDVPERPRSYQGIDYLVDRRGTAAGVLGDFVVFGTENAFRDAVDASRGKSLAEAGEFRAQLARAPDDRVGFVYADPRAIVDALERSGQVTPAQVSSAGPQLEALLDEPVVAWLSATSGELALQASAAGGAAPPSLESPLLRDFPEGSWFAFAVADYGRAYRDLLDQIQDGPGFTNPALPDGPSLDLAREITGWVGDFGAFVGGTSVFGLSGALVLETSDQQASARTLDRLQRLLASEPGLRVEPLSEGDDQGFSLSPAGVPVEVQVVQRDNKVVAGLPDSVSQVFSPTSTLGDSDAFGSATDALGEDFAPVAFLDFVPLLQLAEGFSQVRDDPDYRSAKPYLDHLDYLALGGRRDQDRAEVRVVLGLRDAPAETGGGSEATTAVVGE